MQNTAGWTPTLPDARRSASSRVVVILLRDGPAMLLLVPKSQDVILCPVILEKIPAVNSLSATEKLLLVSELWDDLAAHPTEVPVSREQIAELDRRMEEYRCDPGQVTSWEAIQQRILGRTLGRE